MIPVQLPDCRYVPQACLDLLPPAGDTAANDDDRPRAPDRPRRHQAARSVRRRQAEPGGAAAERHAAPAGRGHLAVRRERHAARRPAARSISAPAGAASRSMTTGSTPSSSRPESGVVFSDMFDGLIDVSVLTGSELGCVAVPGNLLAWDVITTVSELAKSVGGRYIGHAGQRRLPESRRRSRASRLSLFSINLEIVPDTYGPTIKSSKAKVTRQQRRGVRAHGPVAVERPRRSARPVRLQAGGSGAVRRRGAALEHGVQEARVALVDRRLQDRPVRRSRPSTRRIPTRAGSAAWRAEYVAEFEAAICRSRERPGSLQPPRRAQGARRRVPARLGRALPQVHQAGRLLPRKGTCPPNAWPVPTARTRSRTAAARARDFLTAPGRVPTIPPPRGTFPSRG